MTQNAIKMVNGSVDASRVVWDANEGIRISVILKDVFANFPDVDIVKGLQVKPPQKKVIDPIVSAPEKEESINNNSKTNTAIDDDIVINNNYAIEDNQVNEFV